MGEKRKEKMGERKTCRENGEKKKSLKNGPVKIFLFNEELLL